MPRKNPVAIGAAQIFDRHLAAECDDVGRVIIVIAEQNPFGKFVRARIREINLGHIRILNGKRKMENG